MPADELQTVLITSTAMVTEHDMNSLLTERAKDPDNPISCAPSPYGAWVYAHDDPDLYDSYREYGYSESFIRLLMYVREKYKGKVCWINLDQDAQPLEALPANDW